MFGSFLEVCRRRWLFIALAVGVTAGLTAVLVNRQAWVYEASGTFIVRPRSDEAAEVANAVATLIRGSAINSTYANIAESDLVRARASERLGGTMAGLSVRADVVSGTNLFRIAVRGSDPQVVRDFVVALGQETVGYVDELSDMFQLAPLDVPEVPSEPAGPDKVLTVLIGGVVGLGLGISLAFIWEYVSGPRAKGASFDIVDIETRAFNEGFLRLRFGQELARTRRGRTCFSLGVMKVSRAGSDDEPPPSEDLQRVAEVLRPLLRDEDVLAHLGNGTFALILPDRGLDEAERVLADWKDRLVSGGATSLRRSRVKATFGICQYGAEQSNLSLGLSEIVQPV